MSFPRPVAAVIFDMDGLLIDSEGPYRDAMIAAATQFGREMPLELFLSLVGGSAEANEATLRDHFGQDFELESYWVAVRRHIHPILGAGACLKAGVLELLDHLDEAGLPRAICTSSDLERVEHHLGPSGILPRFHAMVTRESVTYGKPHPEPYLKAAAALDIDPALCLALEDSHNGVRAASAAGMMTVMVPDLLHATDEMQTLCVRIAADLHEVHRLVSAHRP